MEVWSAFELGFDIDAGGLVESRREEDSLFPLVGRRERPLS